MVKPDSESSNEEATFFVDYVPGANGQPPIEVRRLLEPHGLTLIGVEAVTDDDQPPFIDVTVLGTVRALRSLSAELDKIPDVLKRGTADTKHCRRNPCLSQVNPGKRGTVS